MGRKRGGEPGQRLSRRPPPVIKQTASLFFPDQASVDNFTGPVMPVHTMDIDDDSALIIRVVFCIAFIYAYDYRYDRTLYLRASVICYIDNPDDNPDARRDYEYSNTWNKDEILTTDTGVEYDANGVKVTEYKWRSTTVKNSLRGTGALGYDEYYKEYKDGLLTYQEEVTFDSDGYPQTYSVDNNGDGVYEETYYSEITKTGEGYLESLLWIEDGTGNKKWKETFSHDEEGLLKRTKDYQMVEDQFVLEMVVTDVWYKNPVNGPTGGIHVYFESDEEGNPLGEYETIEWTITQKIRHYYSSLEEASRITDSLEKIRLQ